jgi:REP element-mobilizing transposase RayT
MAAENINFEAWKPWLREVYKLCDLKVPAMPLLTDHINAHMLPPKRRQKYSDMPWNCCVARAVFKDEIRRSPGAQAALRRSGTVYEKSTRGWRARSKNGTSSRLVPSGRIPKYAWEWCSKYVLRKIQKLRNLNIYAGGKVG